MKNERATMTVKETAAFIGVSMPTAYELVHRAPAFLLSTSEKSCWSTGKG